MPGRRPLVVANWKMNGTRAELQMLATHIRERIETAASVQTVLCPPFVYLAELAKVLDGGKIELGAQDLSQYTSGAHTGEVSACMLRDYNCRFVIVGHSERRELHGENETMIAEKFDTALKAGLTPILCVGEHLEERNSGATEAVISRQIDTAIRHYGNTLPDHTVIAYEPIWAIGTGASATPAQAQEVHELIRSRLSRQATASSRQVRILYGGSVNERNAGELFAMKDIDGGLIGGASLSADSFLAICHAAV